MSVSLARLPMPGPHNNCERQPPMDLDRSISSVIVITRLDPISRAWQQPATLRSSKRPTRHLEPMRSVNAFWVACGASASITYSYCRRSSSSASSMPMWRTSTKPDRIKVSSSRFQSRKLDPRQPSMQVARSSPSRSWAACIVTIDEAHEFFQRAEEMTHRNHRVPLCVHQYGVSCQFWRSMEQARQMGAFRHRSFWLQEQL